MFTSIFLPVSVNDGIESQSVSPGLGEVLHLDPGVLVGRLLGPSQQGLLGAQVLLSNNNVRDLKREKTISNLLSIIIKQTTAH